MADTFTPELNLVKPEVGQSVDTWGQKLNNNMDKLDVAYEQMVADLQAAVAQLEDQRVGTVVGAAGPTPPSGTLKCNGAAVSRTTYARLFAYLGTRYGAGDGSTTFELPDFRGAFPRWYDDGRGLDPESRTWASMQNDDFASHDHGASASSEGHNHGGSTSTNGYHGHSGSTTSDGNHRHTFDYRNNYADGGLPGSSGSNSENNTGYTNYAGNHNHGLNVNGNGNHNHSFTTDWDTHSHSISIGNRGGAETRPVNYILTPCIYY